MTDSDKIKMTINIGGEIISLDVEFNLQDTVRNAEKAVKQFYQECKKKWPHSSEQKIMAMIAYQFSFWYQQLIEKHNEAVEMAQDCMQLLDEAILKDKQSD